MSLSVWVRSGPRTFGFDSLPQAMLTLFECLSLEGYKEVADYLNDMSDTLLPRKQVSCAPGYPLCHNEGMKALHCHEIK